MRERISDVQLVALRSAIPELEGEYPERQVYVGCFMMTDDDLAPGTPVASIAI